MNALDDYEATILATATLYNVVQFMGGCKQRRVMGCTSLAAAAAQGRRMHAEVANGVVIYGISGAHGTIAMTIPKGKIMDVKPYHVLAFTTTAEGTTAQHFDFHTQEEATAFTPPEGVTKAVTIFVPEELEDKLKMAELVATYNLLTPEKPVKSFHDMGAGVPRVWNRMNAHLHPPQGNNNVIVMPAAAGTTQEEPNMAAKKAKTPKAKTEGGTKGRAGKFSDDMVITKLVDENPKRPSSSAFERFKLYKTGQTVAKAIAAGLTRADLNYDADHKFIKISKG